MTPMPENPTPKAPKAPVEKTEKPSTLVPLFEMPKFDFPKFDMPKMEIPAAFREFAEKAIFQAKENYEKVKAAAEEATDLLESTYTTAAKGYSAHGLKVIENARANTDAAFDLLSEMVTAKSYAEVVEVTSGYLRKQFDVATAQAKDLAEHAQKVASETAEPIKEGFTAAFNKAA